AIADFLVDDLLAAPRPTSRGPSITVREVLDDARRSAPGRFASAPLTDAGVRLALGRSYLALGLLGEARAELTAAYSLYSAALGQDDPRTVDAGVSLASL